LAGAKGDEELPPYQEDVLLHHGAQAAPGHDGQWGPYVLTTSPSGKTWTRTYTSPDGTVITEVCRVSFNLVITNDDACPSDGHFICSQKNCAKTQQSIIIVFET